LRYIAHRGNLEGPGGFENDPNQIDFCLNRSFECEIDLWAHNDQLQLGHDFGQFEIEMKWLLERSHFLWIHCKNSSAIKELMKFRAGTFNYFWHQEDKYTITSRGFIWVYPGEEVLAGGISVLPENWLTLNRKHELSDSYAICTDFVFRYSQEFDELKN